jgi:hypothetical protein
MDGSTDCSPNLVANGSVSTNVAPVVSIPSVATLAAVAINTATNTVAAISPSTTLTVGMNATTMCTKPKKIKQARTEKNSVLGSVVGAVGVHRSTGPQIAKDHGVSLSKAYRVQRQANKFPTGTPHAFELARVRKQKDVCAVVGSIAGHMELFPYPIVLRQFENNGLADITESASADRVKASKDRRKRANHMWDMYHVGYHGSRDPLNTLVSVFYQIDSLVQFLESMRDHTHEFLSNLLVVRMSGVFVVIMTDVRPMGRYPGDWFLRIGDHTSAFMWVNLKDACWLRYTSDDTAGSAASCVQQEGSKKRKTSFLCTFSKKPVWTKMSDSTVAGMSVLAHVWRSIQLMLAATGVIVPDSSCIGSSSAFHIHVRPFIELPSSAKSRTGCNVDCDMDIGDTPTCEKGPIRCETWCEDVVAFVEKFHSCKRVRRTNATDPLPVDRALDTASEIVAPGAVSAVVAPDALEPHFDMTEVAPGEVSAIVASEAGSAIVASEAGSAIVASEELRVHFEVKVDKSTFICKSTPEEASAIVVLETASAIVAPEATSAIVVLEAVSAIVAPEAVSVIVALEGESSTAGVTGYVVRMDVASSVRGLPTGYSMPAGRDAECRERGCVPRARLIPCQSTETQSAESAVVCRERGCSIVGVQQNDPIMIEDGVETAHSCAVQRDVISSEYVPLLKRMSDTVDTLIPDQSHQLDDPLQHDDCLCNTPTGLGMDVPSDTDDLPPSAYSKETTDWQDAGNVVDAGYNSVQEDWLVGSPSPDIDNVEESVTVPWCTTFTSHPHYGNYNDANVISMR